MKYFFGYFIAPSPHVYYLYICVRQSTGPVSSAPCGSCTACVSRALRTSRERSAESIHTKDHDSVQMFRVRGPLSHEPYDRIKRTCVHVTTASVGASLSPVRTPRDDTFSSLTLYYYTRRRLGRRRARRGDLEKRTAQVICFFRVRSLRF